MSTLMSTSAFPRKIPVTVAFGLGLMLGSGCDEDAQFLGSKREPADAAVRDASQTEFAADAPRADAAADASLRDGATRDGPTVNPADARSDGARDETRDQDPSPRLDAAITVGNEQRDAAPPGSTLADNPPSDQVSTAADAGSAAAALPTASSVGTTRAPIALPTSWDELTAGAPAGCAIDQYSLTLASCQLLAVCADRSVNVACSTTDDVSSTCTCAQDDKWDGYRVEGTNNLGACGLLLEHCVGASLWGDEVGTCDGVETLDEQSCSRFTSCAHAIPVVGSDVTIFDDRGLRASCSGYYEQGTICNCSGAGEPQTLHFVGSAGSDSCSLAHEICSGERTPDFATDDDCVQGLNLHYSDGCNSEALCGPVAALESGGSVRRASGYSLGCGSANDGLWHCSCLGRADATLGLELPEVQPDPCAALQTVCYPPGPLQQTDAWRCDRSAAAAASEGMCHVAIPCDAHGMIAETSADLRGRVDVRCSESDSGWHCVCGGPLAESAAEFDVPLQDDAQGTCDAAMDECAGLAEAAAAPLSAL